MSIQLVTLKSFSQELSTLPPLEQDEEAILFNVGTLLVNITSSLCEEKVTRSKYV